MKNPHTSSSAHYLHGGPVDGADNYLSDWLAVNSRYVWVL